MCDASDFVERNSGFLLTILAALSACISGGCLCILKSRCTTIKFCGVTCERSVLSEAAVVARERDGAPTAAPV